MWQIRSRTRNPKLRTVDEATKDTAMKTDILVAHHLALVYKRIV
jgi:hypothetical protein